jgi:hypothetical protein
MLKILPDAGAAEYDFRSRLLMQLKLKRRWLRRRRQAPRRISGWRESQCHHDLAKSTI